MLRKLQNTLSGRPRTERNQESAMNQNEENTAAAASNPCVAGKTVLFVPEETDKAPAAKQSGKVCGGGRKGSNKILIVIWVTFLLGGFSGYSYYLQKRAAEAERLLNEAYTLYGQQDFDRSTEVLRQSAELGNAWAQRYYGERLLNGFYAEQNKAEAVKWLRKAAKKKCPEAYYMLGICYENGDGVERDLNKAEAWYRKALDDPGSAYNAQAALDRIESLKAKSGAGMD